MFDELRQPLVAMKPYDPAFWVAFCGLIRDPRVADKPGPRLRRSWPIKPSVGWGEVCIARTRSLFIRLESPSAESLGMPAETARRCGLAHDQDNEKGRCSRVSAGQRPFVHMVGVTGFEPATSSSRTKRATKLRHTPCNSFMITNERQLQKTGSLILSD